MESTSTSTHQMHPNFKNFDDRLWIMGDYAENAFKTFAAAVGISHIHYGMNRPPFTYFSQLPKLIRSAPDFLCETGEQRFGHLLSKQDGDITSANPPRHFFVEVKGCGKDGTFKIKDDQLAEFKEWQKIAARPVVFFLFDQPQNKICFTLSLDRFYEIVPTLRRSAFRDHGHLRPFSVLPVTHPALEWTDLCQYQQDG